MYFFLRTMKKKIYGLLSRLLSYYSSKKHNSLEIGQWGMSSNSLGHIVTGGQDCADLAARFGTPLYIVDRELLQSNYYSFKESFSKLGIETGIYCSYKTNTIPGIIRVLHECGGGAEVISPFELDLAFRLGVPPSSIIYNGPNKSFASLERAVRENIALINVNSLKEIDEICLIAKSAGTRLRVGVRISTSVGWSGQFGFKVSTGDALDAFVKVRNSGILEPAAIHFHLGTGIKNATTYVKAITEAVSFMQVLKNRLGINISILDIGGGFAVPTVRDLTARDKKLHSSFNIPFSPPVPSDTYSIHRIATIIADTLKRECAAHGIDIPSLYLEPGRALTCNTQILLGRVGDFKTADDGRTMALCDAGLNLALPTTWEYHEIFAATRMNEPPSEQYCLAGPTCNPSDVLTRSKILPRLEVGDIIAVMDAGAYFTSFSYNFSFPKPAIVMLDRGTSRIIHRREIFDDMLTADISL